MRETQRKGDIATAQAIATFTNLGYDVSIPITESAKYDLIIDINEGLKRVQVKYTSRKQVDLRNTHMNSKGCIIKKTKQNDYDWLYCLWIKEDGRIEQHLFKNCFVDRNSITLTDISKINFGG